MLVRVGKILAVSMVLASVAGLAGGPPAGVAARERSSPRISLSLYQCPPGMTDATLATVIFGCVPSIEMMSTSNPEFSGVQSTVASVASVIPGGH